MVSSRGLGDGVSPMRETLQAWATCVIPQAILTLLLLLSSQFGPLLGGVLGLFAPAPAIHAYLRGGRRAGTVTLGLVFFALVGLTGLSVGLKFLLLVAPLVVLLSEGIRIRASVERVVLISLSPALILAAIALLLHWGGSGGALVDLFRVETSVVLEGTARPGGGAGGELVARLLWRSLPAITFLNFLWVSLVNYMVIRWFWIRRGGRALFPSQDFSQWGMPERAVWLLIVFAASLLLPWEATFWVGWNGFILLLFGYFLQGIAVLHHLFKQRGVMVPFRVPVYLVGLLMPYLLAAAGLFDLWMDFRKIRVPSTEQAHGGEER